MKATMAVICLVTLFMVVPCFGEPLVLGPNRVNLCGVHVYDAEDQYLGLLLNAAGSIVTVFIPELNLITVIVRTSGKIARRVLYSESTDCSNPHYTNCIDYVFRDYVDEKLYTGIHPPIEITPRTVTSPAYGCHHINDPTQMMFKAVEVSIDIFPFTLPVSLPLRLQAGLKALSMVE